MANISIYEKELTSRTVQDVTANIIYVPGYSVYGPVNKPTLCESYSDFISKFGKVPYRFISAQPFPEKFKIGSHETNEYFAPSNSYEKSFIYASELLQNGGKVLFERVMPKSKVDDFTAKAEINAVKYVGKLVEFSAERNTVYCTKNEESDEYTRVDVVYSELNGSFYKISENESGGLVYDADAGVYKAKQDEEDVPFYTAESVDLTSNVEQNVSYYTRTGVSYTEVGHSDLVSGVSYYIQQASDNKISIKANHPGSVGKNISCTLSTESDGTYTVVANINDSVNGIVGKDEITISLDPTSSSYWGNINGVVNRVITMDFSIQDDGVFVDSMVQLDYSSSNEEFSVSDMYNEFETITVSDKGVETSNTSIFDKLESRNDYAIKFISTGAYPIFEFNNNSIVKRLLKICTRRGDVVPLIDHTEYANRDLVGDNSVFNSIQSIADWTDASVNVGALSKPEDCRKCGEMYSPWGVFNSKTIAGQVFSMPGSFAYLMALTESIKTNVDYYAVAGVSRGLVPNLIRTKQEITGAVADMMQSKSGIAINPIVDIKPYGYCIWGNSTLNPNSGEWVPSSYASTRVLICDIKKEVYAKAVKYMFENNSEVLWLNFRSELAPVLDKMVANNGLSSYKITKKDSTERGTLNVLVRVWVVDAVDSFDVDLEITDSYINIE